LALFIDVQIHANCVRAFLILTDILQIELLTLARFLFLRIIGVGNQGLAPLVLRKRFEKVDNVVEFGRIHSSLLNYLAFKKLSFGSGGPMTAGPKPRKSSAVIGRRYSKGLRRGAVGPQPLPPDQLDRQAML